MRPLVLALALAACSTPPQPTDDPPDAAPMSSNLLPGFTPDPPAQGEIQIVSPIVHAIAPGADVTLCSYLPVSDGLATDLDVTHVAGYQSMAGAHHVGLYQARANRPVDSHPCTDDDMANALPLAFAGGEGTNAFAIPDGLALRAKAHAQLFFQTHWINSTDHMIDGQAAFDLRVQPVSSSIETAGLFSIVATQFTIPKGQTGTATTSCTFAHDVQWATMYGHAHEWGTRVRIFYTPSGGAEQVLYDHPWTPHATFTPPGLAWPLTSPFVAHTGDTIRVQCDYDNTTDHDLTFPQEMCAAAGLYFPGDAQLNCVDGAWPSN